MIDAITFNGGKQPSVVSEKIARLILEACGVQLDNSKGCLDGELSKEQIQSGLATLDGAISECPWDLTDPDIFSENVTVTRFEFNRTWLIWSKELLVQLSETDNVITYG